MAWTSFGLDPHPESIKNAYPATRIWDLANNEHNINNLYSQYALLAGPMSPSIAKAPLGASEKLASLHSRRASKRLRVTETRNSIIERVAGGSKIVRSIIAGKVLSSLTLSDSRSRADEIQREREDSKSTQAQKRKEAWIRLKED